MKLGKNVAQFFVESLWARASIALTFFNTKSRYIKNVKNVNFTLFKKDISTLINQNINSGWKLRPRQRTTSPH